LARAKFPSRRFFAFDGGIPTTLCDLLFKTTYHRVVQILGAPGGDECIASAVALYLVRQFIS
jgi:hypothetical protein